MTVDKKELSVDLIDLVGMENIILDDKKLRVYGVDPFGNEHKPLMVVKPSAPVHFKRLNFILRRYKIDSITPRGLGLDINLGAFSEDIVIDLTLLNKNLQIDEHKSLATAQAGITYKSFQKTLKEKGYRLNIEPILNGTIGAFIASGGYGYGSYRYGTIINILRNTNLFLSNGQTIQTGTLNVPAYCSGYNLNSLVCGSEGYFGIITEATFEISPIPEESLNILLSIKNDDKLFHRLIELTKLSTIYHISLYKAILNNPSDSIELLIRFEGPQNVIEKNQSLIDNIEGVSLSDAIEADQLWESRIIEPTSIPAAGLILGTLIPTNQISNYFRFLDGIDSPHYFGIFINASTILLYAFLSENLSDSRKNEILIEFLKKTDEIQARPPTLGNNIKKFVEKSYPNLKLLKHIKPIFDETNRLKSRKLNF